MSSVNLNGENSATPAEATTSATTQAWDCVPSCLETEIRTEQGKDLAQDVFSSRALAEASSGAALFNGWGTKKGVSCMFVLALS